MNYSKYSTEDLFETYKTSIEYSGKIDADLEKEIQTRGGIDSIKNELREKNIAPEEKKRIAKEILKYSKDGTDFDFIKQSITSDIFTQEQLDKVIEQTIIDLQAYKKDTAITSNTIIRCLIGLLISTVICSTIWCYSIMSTGSMHYFLTAIFLLISFVIIRAITRQSAKNVLVFLATFFSAFLSIIFGTMLYHYIVGITDNI